MAFAFLHDTLGGYQPSPDYKLYDSVIGNSYGTFTSRESVNARIRHYADEMGRQAGCPVFMDGLLAETTSQLRTTPDPALVYGGPFPNALGIGGGSFGYLEFALERMYELGLSRPLLVAHSYHVGRLAIQARKLGVNPLLPPGLPRQFDAKLVQAWTLSPALWLPHELVGAVVLKMQGKL